MTSPDFLLEGHTERPACLDCRSKPRCSTERTTTIFTAITGICTLQDEWKVRGNLTLNLGVRYEYVSPFTEENNRIANLDLSPAVLNPASGDSGGSGRLAGQTGPYSGSLPASLVRPDRNNFAPRVGIAWKPFSKTVVRAGYGINYNTGAYQGIVQQLAFQPPFSTTATNIQAAAGNLTLQNGFPTRLTAGHHQ